MCHVVCAYACVRTPIKSVAVGIAASKRAKKQDIRLRARPRRAMFGLLGAMFGQLRAMFGQLRAMF
eukprot:6599141-Pyramimonas_sp.AAC.1